MGSATSCTQSGGILALQLPNQASFEEMRTAHDRIEQWLRTTHYSHRTLQDLDHHTASLCERALVDAQNVEGYLADLCQSVLHTETAPATFVAQLHRCVQNAQQASLFHEISIPRDFGGRRVLETSLLVSSKKSNGEHFEFLFAQYADFSRLAPALGRMAAAHHEENIKLWLNYKLCLRILDEKPGLLTITGKQGVVACKPVCSTPNHKPGLLTITDTQASHELLNPASFEEMRTAHDRMEQWLRTTHYSHRTLQDLDHHTASLCERALVDAQNVEGYLADLCQSVLHTETAPATFVAQLHRCVQNAQQASLFHEISIPRDFGGRRVLETSLLVSSKKSNGEHFEFLFAQYADFSRLAPALRRMAAAHHKEESIKLWLNYKLCLRILDDKPGLLTITGKQGVVAGAPRQGWSWPWSWVHLVAHDPANPDNKHSP